MRQITGKEDKEAQTHRCKYIQKEANANKFMSSKTEGNREKRKN